MSPSRGGGGAAQLVSTNTISQGNRIHICWHAGCCHSNHD